MKNIFNFKTLFLAVVLATGLLASCKDEEMLPGVDRLFRPIANTATVSMTWIKIDWDKYKGAKHYVLDLSVDSFKTVLRTSRTDSATYTFTGLDYDTKYNIRIHSVGDSILSNGDTIKSLNYVLPDVTTLDYPTLLTSPTSNDLIDNSIRMYWTLSSDSYTRVDVMINKDSVYKSVLVTAAENLAGTKIISGLQPGVNYMVKIFQGANYKGKKYYKTTAAQVFTGDVVDLRNFSDDKALSVLNQTFVDSLATAHPAGFNLVLSGGTSYTLPTINVSVPMNIITGLSFKGKAIMAVNGGFGIAAAKTVSSLRFEKIFFTQGNTSGKLKTDANYGGTYLFNLNLTNGNIGSMTLENCDIKYKRGVIRMQTTATITSLTINNCLMDSIGGYGVVNNANAASYIGDIVVTNSTVAHADKLFVGGASLGIKSLTIQNLTTCYAPQSISSPLPAFSANYFFDYKGNTIPGGITITNSLFGAGGNAAVNGMQSSCQNITMTNCYKASDLTWYVNPTTLATAPIDAFVSLGKLTTDIFTDPVKSNFKIKDATTASKKIGDPRWW